MLAPILLLAAALTPEESSFVSDAIRHIVSSTTPPPRANLRATVRDEAERMERAARDLDALLLRFPGKADDERLQQVREMAETMRGSAEVARKILRRSAPTKAELDRQRNAFASELVTPAIARLRPLAILAGDPSARVRMPDTDAEFAMEHLARVERACDDVYVDVAQLDHPDESQSPSLWCRIAADRFRLTELARGR